MKNNKNKLLFFFQKNEGMAAIEFAFVGTTFIFIIIGIIQIGMMMMIQNALEAGVREISRYGITGATKAGYTRAETIVELIMNTCSDYSGGLIVPDKLTISISSYPDLTNLDLKKGQENSYGVGGEAVLYKLSYPWESLLSLLGNKGPIVISAESPVVNESF